MRFENSELRAFQAIVETHGFNRAAEHLHVSQSAVSQSLANLESKLDMKLLLRDKQLTLTEGGRRVLEYANEMLREEKQVLEDLQRIQRGDQQILNLAINSTINRFYAPVLLNIFCKQHGDTVIKVAELPSRELIYGILAGRAELAMGPFQSRMDAFTTVPLFAETRRLVVSPNHPDVENICNSENTQLQQTPLIASSLDNPQMRPAIQRIRDNFKSVWEVSSLRMRIHFVDLGLGAAFIDSKLLDDDPVCRQFVTLDGIPFGSIERDVGVYYKKGKKLSASSGAFIEICKQFWPPES
ncbi:hypothetical protein AB833_17525 [Chromatiales bacterium (ex Bugula neritina AB1)]|nr:hypothetical protein AB833_17525 [Chromatiales bacterium (ex Bugula neritina AB1)]